MITFFWSIGNLFLQALVLSWTWSMFISPLGTPALGFYPAMGLLVVWSVIRAGSQAGRAAEIQQIRRWIGATDEDPDWLLGDRQSFTAAALTSTFLGLLALVAYLVGLGL